MTTPKDTCSCIKGEWYRKTTQSVEPGVGKIDPDCPIHGCTCHTVPVMPFPDIAVDPKCPLHGKRVDVVSPQPDSNKGWADSTVKGQPAKPTERICPYSECPHEHHLRTPTSQGAPECPACGHEHYYECPRWGCHCKRNNRPKETNPTSKASQGAPEPINTHHLTIDFGKHKGERWTRLPIGYLVWLVNEGTQVADIAQAELDRRGYTPPTELVVSDHAIDRASLFCRKHWHETAEEGEGLMTWLKRIANESLTKATTVTEENGEFHCFYQGMKLVFAPGELYPTLKTVINKKDPK